MHIFQKRSDKFLKVQIKKLSLSAVFPQKNLWNTGSEKEYALVSVLIKNKLFDIKP